MKICVLCESVYPLRNDATGKIAYFLSSEFKNNYNDVTVVTKSFSFKKQSTKVIEGMNYIILKSERQYLYSFVEVLDLYKKNPIKQILGICKLLFLKILFRLRDHKKTKSFLELFPKGINVDNTFDIVVLVAGNYELMQLLNSDYIKAKKKVLYATDYWDEKKYDYVIKHSFDAAYGRESYLVDEKSFVKGIYRGIHLIVDSEFKNPIEIEKNDSKEMSYFGKFYRSRDYSAFLRILDSISQTRNNFRFLIKIYTDKVSLKKKYKNIKFSNLVFGEKYHKATLESSWLLVLDNTIEYQKWIPSKLYEAMLYKKPIVFFTDNSNSFALKDLKQYDLSFVVDMNDYNDSTIDSLIDFLLSTNGKTSKLDLFELFPECEKHNFYKLLLLDLNEESH